MSCKLLIGRDLREWPRSGYEPVGWAFESLRAHHSKSFQINQSVVCAASYEARRFGGRSALPAVTTERLCPQAICVLPDFTRCKAASRATREIFQRHTNIIEPLSLDEAYLDVTMNKTGLPTPTKVAIAFRQQIREELSLTASAGVAPNKFLAKIASDWRKPDGLFVIQPKDFDTFLRPLPVPRIPGVGGVTEARLKQIGIQIVGDLHSFELDAIFGWPAPFLSSGNSTFSSLPRPNIPKSGGAWHRF